ncbi:hypothetical protein Molly5_52 [Maribacter phage Molly_5]|uniref:Uncharacterized protein n=1 Tax=Maribacter phage Molly_1 TaxID=2745685 RepID=A0A8E4UYG0_9CAUD|nr:hypothetical protein M1M29_gp052 [Maribacter phage Molly_1]QQO97736.1 hypothetical protein Molly2_52 [Maribacter phage Molly_2]QQO97936.1 hypothetical protein Molly3_52 [Maribacter phage Molly_3]QQO98136.1 hypothetical protein Molly4_52 [Maribacter phage Molly_4]QQO98336.1 hypothetical protein Molly5_52 [Maribacter phage Molly_5]QQO97536.1 hypothetical protein Molly1_52 [Maribacter phage Molly_1]
MVSKNALDFITKVEADVSLPSTLREEAKQILFTQALVEYQDKSINSKIPGYNIQSLVSLGSLFYIRMKYLKTNTTYIAMYKDINPLVFVDQVAGGLRPFESQYFVDALLSNPENNNIYRERLYEEFISKR